MKNVQLLFFLLLANVAVAQHEAIIPNLEQIDTSNNCVLINRDIKVGNGVHFNAKPSNGLLWFNTIDFANGTIEVDLKGKDEQGKSFVGIAFHGLNDSVYDAIYFRAFNFRNAERINHSVQYISHPDYPWYVLRKQFPEKYESDINPVPEPNEWFHATIVVEYPVVKVYVNNAKEPSLVVNQLSNRKQGWVGFWAGYGSEGSYNNLKILPE